MKIECLSYSYKEHKRVKTQLIKLIRKLKCEYKYIKKKKYITFIHLPEYLTSIFLKLKFGSSSFISKS